MRNRPAYVILALALLAGIAIGFIDSRPGWDDTGVTAGSVLLASAVLAAIRPRSAWVIGLAVGLPVLLFDAALHGTYEAAAAVVLGLAGAGIGFLVGKALNTGEAPTAA